MALLSLPVTNQISKATSGKVPLSQTGGLIPVHIKHRMDLALQNALLVSGAMGKGQFLSFFVLLVSNCEELGAIAQE